MKFSDVVYYLNCIFMLKFHSNLLLSLFSNLFTPTS